ncbi:MAG: hypothetical protein ABIP03_15865 [Aquihabitans sp.]
MSEDNGIGSEGENGTPVRATHWQLSCRVTGVGRPGAPPARYGRAIAALPDPDHPLAATPRLAGAGTGRLRNLSRTLAGREALTLVGAALVVQVVMPYRHDLPAHVVGGGAAALLGAALVPRFIGRTNGELAGFAIFAWVVALAWLAEQQVFGPFDLVDVSFTLAGALVVMDCLPEVINAPSEDRQSVFWAGVLLIMLALLYRYGLTRGAA